VNRGRPPRPAQTARRAEASPTRLAALAPLARAGLVTVVLGWAALPASAFAARGTSTAPDPGVTSTETTLLLAAPLVATSLPAGHDRWTATLRMPLGPPWRPQTQARASARPGRARTRAQRLYARRNLDGG